MQNIAEKLRERRNQLGLTINEASDATKIRPHILTAIEEGNFDVLPQVYIKSFLKTYSKYLKVTIEDFSQQEVVGVKKEFNDVAVEEKPKPIQEKASKTKDKTNYSQLFNQKKKRSFNSTALINYSIYLTIFVAFAVTTYFTFFYSSSKSKEEQANATSQTSDTTMIKSEKNILSYFQENDSLKLKAVAIDTAWVRIEMDGKEYEEILLTPSMEKTWSAVEFFSINQGNVGAVKFYRNNQLLEPFGNRGTVVRNVKVTANEVINTIPIDTSRTKKQVYQTRKKEKKSPPKLIEESEIAKPKKIMNEPKEEESPN